MLKRSINMANTSPLENAVRAVRDRCSIICTYIYVCIYFQYELTYDVVLAR